MKKHNSFLLSVLSLSLSTVGLRRFFGLGRELLEGIVDAHIKGIEGMEQMPCGATSLLLAKVRVHRSSSTQVMPSPATMLNLAWCDALRHAKRTDTLSSCSGRGA